MMRTTAPELAELATGELALIEGGACKNTGFLCAVAYAAGKCARAIKNIGDDNKWFG